jgi:hypothetical protein
MMHDHLVRPSTLKQEPEVAEDKLTFLQRFHTVEGLLIRSRQDQMKSEVEYHCHLAIQMSLVSGGDAPHEAHHHCCRQKVHVSYRFALIVRDESRFCP